MHVLGEYGICSVCKNAMSEWDSNSKHRWINEQLKQ